MGRKSFSCWILCPCPRPAAASLREQGLVCNPSVLWGGQENIHLFSPNPIDILAKLPAGWKSLSRRFLCPCPLPELWIPGSGVDFQPSPSCGALRESSRPSLPADPGALGSIPNHSMPVPGASRGAGGGSSPVPIPQGISHPSGGFTLGSRDRDRDRQDFPAGLSRLGPPAQPGAPGGSFWPLKVPLEALGWQQLHPVLTCPAGWGHCCHLPWQCFRITLV